MEDLRYRGVPKTGDPLIDDQHVAIRQLLEDAEACGDQDAELLRILDRLMRHVDFHFATEEQLMRRCGYEGPQEQEHVASHRRLRELARDTVIAYRAGRLDSVRSIVRTLRTDWLVDHVYNHDQRFAEFVRESGLAADLPDSKDRVVN